MFDNPRKSLRWMEDELLDEELEDILYGGEDDEDDDEYEEKPKRGKKKYSDTSTSSTFYKDKPIFIVTKTKTK